MSLTNRPVMPNPASRHAVRKTTQDLLPLARPPVLAGQYDMYPAHTLPAGSIRVGWAALAESIRHDAIGMGTALVLIDGYIGVLWDDLCRQLTSAFAVHGTRIRWINIAEALYPPDAIDRLIAPFLGGDDPLFGTRFTGTFEDFFDPVRMTTLKDQLAVGGTDHDLTIVYGCGAGLIDQAGLLVYCDLPKNEIQYRARAGSIANLGMNEQGDPKAMYKRFYFVDWIALNRHKADFLNRIGIVVDTQHPEQPSFSSGDTIRAALHDLSHTVFRVRPWFEPGVWGGQWIKQHIPHIPQEARNYAWSFELITPENGLLFESDGHLLEIAFDWLMIQESRAVLGASEARFGVEFPIRFDFLDTIDGDHLSIQCHPRPDYMREHFGESFTQDETYYILQHTPGARVYLGFQDHTDPAAFQAAIETSTRDDAALDVDRWIQSSLSEQHGLYLIPGGTIHGAGRGNLVLEISATPYIFTFKIYDWLRLDLDGNPRPINLSRALDNLCYDRQGSRIPDQFIAHPVMIAEGTDWRVLHLATHPEHFYDVHRLEFSTVIDVETHGSPHVLSLVEGAVVEIQVEIQTADSYTHRFSAVETFVVPAAAERYRLISPDHTPIKVIKAFMKPITNSAT